MNPTTVSQNGAEITVTRTFDSPAPTVFEAWTQADLFRVWWAPKSMGAAISRCEIDAWSGGGYRITFGEGGDAATFFGRYLEVIPGSRLVWTNDESDGAPVTTVTFTPDGQRTLLAMCERFQADPPDAEGAEGMRAMAEEQFGQLDALLRARAA